MKISRVVRNPKGNGPGRPTQIITIEIEAGDDPQGHINGLVAGTTDRLGAFLRVYAGSPASEPTSVADAEQLLTHFGYVAGRTESGLNDLMWASRDTRGLSWRSMAGLVEIPATTIRRRVDRWRQHGADSGYWRDETGRVFGTPAEAKARLAALDEDQES
jgi:hypothetical protein